MSDNESPYCPICDACGEDGCCSALNCEQHPDGDYCTTYLRDLKFGYKMNRWFENNLEHKLPKELQEEYNRVWDKVWDETYLENKDNA